MLNFFANSLDDEMFWAKMVQAMIQVLTKKRKERATATKKRNYLHVIKPTLTKIYKTFKSFESVKNVHVCHQF